MGARNFTGPVSIAGVELSTDGGGGGAAGVGEWAEVNATTLPFTDAIFATTDFQFSGIQAVSNSFSSATPTWITVSESNDKYLVLEAGSYIVSYAINGNISPADPDAGVYVYFGRTGSGSTEYAREGIAHVNGETVTNCSEAGTFTGRESIMISVGETLSRRTFRVALGTNNIVAGSGEISLNSFRIMKLA